MVWLSGTVARITSAQGNTFMNSRIRRAGSVLLLALGAAACNNGVTSPSVDAAAPSLASGSGGGGGGTVKVDQIKVSKCYWIASGEMLIKAASSDPTARLFAYKPDGSLIGEVQNGGGVTYWVRQGPDPVDVRFLCPLPR